MENKPKKTYEELEAELKRVKAKSSARRKNIQGMSNTLIAYKSLYTQYFTYFKEKSQELDKVKAELREIKQSKAYSIVKGIFG